MSAPQAAERRRRRSGEKSRRKTVSWLHFPPSPHLRSLPVMAEYPLIREEIFAPIRYRHRAVAGRRAFSGPRLCTFFPAETLCRPSSPSLSVRAGSFASSRLFPKDKSASAPSPLRGALKRFTSFSATGFKNR